MEVVGIVSLIRINNTGLCTGLCGQTPFIRLGELDLSSKYDCVYRIRKKATEPLAWEQTIWITWGQSVSCPKTEAFQVGLGEPVGFPKQKTSPDQIRVWGADKWSNVNVFFSLNQCQPFPCYRQPLEVLGVFQRPHSWPTQGNGEIQRNVSHQPL